MQIRKITNTIAVFFLSCCLLPKPMLLAQTRKPVVAGSFYPKNKKLLSDMIDKYLQTGSLKNKETKKPFGLIVPHAGYPYSGPVAGYSYNLLKKYADHFDTVVILGVNHYQQGFSPNSIFKGEFYESPLGKIEIDQKLKNRLSKYYGIRFDQKAHAKEHSIETQIPFIQKSGNFKILPIIVGDYSAKNCSFLAEVLIKELIEKDEKVLFLASSDFSHYHPYKKAKMIDAKALKAIAALDLKGFAVQNYKTREIEMCGYGPTMILMIMAKKLGYSDVEILKYLNSGDTKGSKDNVVGYASVAFYPENKSTKGEKIMNTQNILNAQDKTFLLETARKTLINHIKEENKPEITNDKPIFTQKRGAFVTLHKNGNLRGCIGYIEPYKPLLNTVIENTKNASTNDFRFPRVTADELDQIEIEISVLTVPKKSKLEDIVLGRDGIILEKYGRSAVFLPQVAPEQGWDLDTTLSQLAQKAGLPSDAWKEDCEFLTFEAEVFSEVSESHS